MKSLSPMSFKDQFTPVGAHRPLTPALQGGAPHQGGVVPQQVPVTPIPWDGYVACGVKVQKDDKVQVALFDPQPMADADEVFQMVRLLLAAVAQRSGVVIWDTVPDGVKRHLRFEDGDSAASPTGQGS